MSGTKEKKLNLPQSLLLLLLIIVSVAVCIRLKTGGPMIGLFASWIFIYLFCKIFGISYANIVAGAYDAIRMVVPTLCLLMAIGVMIGTWLQSGTIATIISWGLKMINPSWLLPLTLLFCSILSIVTGTSYGSAGSAGVAMMAIGNAMGIHPGMVAGAVMNFVLGFVVLVILVAAQEGAITSKTIYSIENDALCGQTGLQAGDEIVAVNGRRCFVANDILYELVRTEAYRARFTVKRDGQKVELPDVQFDTWQDENGQTHMTLGFTVYGIKKTPLNVLKEAWNSTLYYGRIAFISLADLVRGRESINNLSGPVGIVTAIGQAASYGWQDLLELLALITINLGVFNLLPFPALDGGKVVFLIIEGVTGHAVPEKLQGTLTIAAFALLFGLMLFATYNDIIRLVTGAM